MNLSVPAGRVPAVGWSPWAAVADHPDVDVLFVPGLPTRGLYWPDRQTICIRSGLTRTMRRSILAEEYAHHQLGHRPHPDRSETARLELRARRWAARRLISLTELAAALRGASSWAEVAEALDVDVALLHARTACLSEGERLVLQAAAAGV